MKRASKPFQFVTASYLTRIDNQRATTAGELRDGLERCSDASVFYHTFQSLGRHHFLIEGFSNDFAQWALAGLNRPWLAEQLGSLDVRSYLSLVDLRTDLLRILDDFCRAQPEEAQRLAFEAFNFCSSLEVTAPLAFDAWTLEEFRNGVERLGHGSFQFHFLVSRLRVRLETNDFSLWLEEELGLKGVARRVNQIDVVTNTIDEARTQVVALLDKELAS